MQPKLVALDVDGTLVGHSLTISPGVRAAIARMQDAGITGSLITGRMYRAVLPFVRELGFEAPIVCYQGAAVIDPTTDEVLYHVALENDVVRDIIALAEREHAHLQLYRNDEYYCETRNRFSEFYASLAMHEPIIVPSLRETFAYSEATKAVIVADPSDAERFVAEMHEHLGARAYVTRSLPQFVEILSPKADKGVALRMVAARLGIEMSDVIAVGDSWNDVPLLQAAGFGIAMGSGPPELKAVAHAVVADVEHDGVAKAIDDYVLAESEARPA